jgi:predicted permease
LNDLWFRARSLLFSRRADRELAEEVQFHLDCERAKLESTGLDRAEAQRRAVLAFGGVSAVTEACRDARGVGLLADVSTDIRYGWRGLRRSPLFAVTVVGSLVLGIGANVTVFTLIRAALWRPMPVSHPEQIVHVRRASPTQTDLRDTSSSYLLYQQLREAAGPQAHIVAKGTAARRKFGIDPDSKERVIGEAVTEDFFDMLGVPPVAGRLFVPGDDSPSGGRRVAVLSHRFWTTRFSGDAGILGSTIYYDEMPFTVVGVAARGFDGVDAERRVQVWIPVTADVQITPDWLRSPSYYWLTLLGRLQPGAREGDLQGVLDVRFRAHLETALLPDMPPRIRSFFRSEHIQIRRAAAGLATTGRRYEPQLRVLAGIAACMFLICCANVANLVRARNARRRDEFALRRALGASGPRLVRQLLVEGLMLGVAGMAGSLLVAPWISASVLALLPTPERLAFDLAPDRAIMAVAIALGAVSSMTAIANPAWWPARTPGSQTLMSRVTRRQVTSRATVAIQLAIVLVLLVVAGLCLSVLQRLDAVALGFDATSVAAVDISFPRGAPAPRVASIFEDVRRRLEQSGGVESSSYAFPAVYDSGGSSMGIAPTGYTPAPGEDITAGTILVGPGFFTTLRIPVKEGRAFDATDISARAPVVVVNETFARRYFAGRPATGESVRIPALPRPTVSTIVGVVGDVRHYGARTDPWPMVYSPGPAPGARLLVRGRDQTATLAAVRAAVESAGAPVQIEAIRPLADAVSAMIGRERLLAVLSSGVALVAIMLAALGLYGIVAYGVTCRRSEFGIRLALGARRVDVHRLVLAETASVVAIGVIAGIAGAAAASRLLSGLVASSPALEWPLLSGAVIALVAVALLASWIPAWRASRTDPALTLRAE